MLSKVSGTDLNDESDEESEFKDTNQNVNGESLAVLAQKINQMKIEKEEVSGQTEADELDIDIEDEDLEDLDDVDDVELSD